MQLTDGWKVGSMWEMGVVVAKERGSGRFRPLCPRQGNAAEEKSVESAQMLPHRFGTFPGSPTRPNYLGIFTFFPGPTLLFARLSLFQLPRYHPRVTTEQPSDSRIVPLTGFMYIFFPAE